MTLINAFITQINNHDESEEKIIHYRQRINNYKRTKEKQRKKSKIIKSKK